MTSRPSVQLDDIDRLLLDLIQHDSAVPLHQFGATVGLSPSAVQRRLARYRETGIIAREIAVVDPTVLAGTVLACVLVNLDRESTELHGAFQQRILTAPHVQQCYDLAGEWDYLLIIAANGMIGCRSAIDELLLDTAVGRHAG